MCGGINLNKNLFLQWWLLNLLVFVVSAIGFKLGLFHEIYYKDSSYLCFVIMSIYVVVSIFNGIISKKDKVVIEDLEIGWFWSEICLSLGMIGTVIGFIQMLSGFSVMESGSTKNIQTLIVKMSYGMSTALYTTLAGLVFGNLIKLQCFQLDRFHSSKEKEKTDGQA
jgi:hypothetical protein